MAATKLRPAVLIVSDTASEDPSTDGVGGTLTPLFTDPNNNAWMHPIVEIVPDKVLDIQRAVCSYADGPEPFNLIVTSGGTGFAVKDNTPEVGCSLPPLIARPCFVNPILFFFYRRCLPSSIVMHRDLCASCSENLKGLKEEMHSY